MPSTRTITLPEDQWQSLLDAADEGLDSREQWMLDQNPEDFDLDEERGNLQRLREAVEALYAALYGRV